MKCGRSVSHFGAAARLLNPTHTAHVAARDLLRSDGLDRIMDAAQRLRVRTSPQDAITAVPAAPFPADFQGVLSAAARGFGGVPSGCDPIRSATQVRSGRIHRLSHWTTPP
jgi:hypothetical protein